MYIDKVVSLLESVLEYNFVIANSPVYLIYL